MKDAFDSFLDRLSRPISLPLALIESLVVQAGRIIKRVATVPLLPAKQKKALGGYLFMEGPTLVEQVASGLDRYRHCFPEIHVDPAELRQGLRRATGLLSLRQFGLLLIDIADDYYALEMGTLVRTVIGIVRHVRADRQRLYPGPHDAERREAMAAAEDTLAAFHRRIQKKK